MTARVYAKRGQHATTSYLGFPIRIENTLVTVYDPYGQRIPGPVRWGLPSVRAFIRGYRGGGE